MPQCLKVHDAPKLAWPKTPGRPNLAVTVEHLHLFLPIPVVNARRSAPARQTRVSRGERRRVTGARYHEPTDNFIRPDIEVSQHRTRQK